MLVLAYLQVTELTRKCSQDVGDSVRRMISRLMSNELAVRFSWKGSRGEKEAFEKSALKGILYGKKKEYLILKFVFINLLED